MPENIDIPESKVNLESRSQSSVNPVVDLYTGFEENTYFKSPLVEESFRPPYNQDDLWNKTGSFSIYEEMSNDDQISVCLRLKKDLILGEGGYFIPGDSEQDDIINHLNKAFFEQYSGEFDSDLEEILTSYEFGFSITEKIFKYMSDGMLGIKGLRTRHPDSFRLHQDIKGNVIKYEQITTIGNIDVNPKSIIHFINDPRFQNPYGNSDLRTAYAAWFTKRQVIKYYAIFLEKSASPIPVGRFDKNAPAQAIDDIFNSLKRFQTKTALVIPKEIEVQFLESTNKGEAYAKALHYFNMVIGRSLFVPDLVGFTGSETGGGSLSLGKEQMSLFFKHILRRRKSLEIVINKELVQPIINYNYGFIEKPPVFKFKPLNDLEAVELAKVWLEAVKSRVYQATNEEVNHFRKLVKFPEQSIEEMEEMQEKRQEMIDAQMGVSSEEKESEENEKEKESSSENGEKENEQEADKKEFALGKFPPGSYHKKVDFKAMKTKLDDYDNSLIKEAQPIVKKMIMDLSDQIQKKKIIQNQNVEKIDTISIKYKKELKQILNNSFYGLYKDAKKIAQTEVQKSNFAKQITDDKFLEIVDMENYNAVGDWTYNWEKSTRVKLVQAIKDGESLSAVLNSIEEELKKMSEAQIERYARTKHTEVMNRGRRDYFDSTGVITGYQFSAIMDSVTSEICAALDGKFFKNDELAPTPPLHFNCRSALVPITMYEQFTPTESIEIEDENGETKEIDINKFIDDNIGKGFSRYTQEIKPIEIKEEVKKEEIIQPQVTDQGVEIETIFEGSTETIKYFLNGKVFQESISIYEDESKQKLISLKHKRISE
jgi:SPP1 gp7 family putative phage head morphogenesis protein